MAARGGSKRGRERGLGSSTRARGDAAPICMWSGCEPGANRTPARPPFSTPTPEGPPPPALIGLIAPRRAPHPSAGQWAAPLAPPRGAATPGHAPDPPPPPRTEEGTPSPGAGGAPAPRAGAAGGAGADPERPRGGRGRGRGMEEGAGGGGPAGPGAAAPPPAAPAPAAPPLPTAPAAPAAPPPAALYPHPDADHEQLVADPDLFMRLLLALHAALAGAPQPPKSKAPSKFRIPVGARPGGPRRHGLADAGGRRARSRCARHPGAIPNPHPLPHPQPHPAPPPLPIPTPSAATPSPTHPSVRQGAQPPHAVRPRHGAGRPRVGAAGGAPGQGLGPGAFGRALRAQSECSGGGQPSAVVSHSAAIVPATSSRPTRPPPEHPASPSLPARPAR
jgi:hypothetical protein